MALTKILLAQHGKNCPYCNVIMRVQKPKATKQPFFPTRDHVIPKKIMCGQPTIFVCRQCNSDKGSFLLSEWLLVLREKNDPRAEYVAVFIENNRHLLGDFA
jgi:hypothetical protein